MRLWKGGLWGEAFQRMGRGPEEGSGVSTPPQPPCQAHLCWSEGRVARAPAASSSQAGGGGHYHSLVGHLLLHPTARSSSELAAALGGRVPSSITPILQMREQSLGVGKPHSQVPPERVTCGPGGCSWGRRKAVCCGDLEGSPCPRAQRGHPLPAPTMCLTPSTSPLAQPSIQAMLQDWRSHNPHSTGGGN